MKKCTLFTGSAFFCKNLLTASPFCVIIRLQTAEIIQTEDDIMEKSETQEKIRSLSEKGLKLADSLTEEMNAQFQETQKYQEKYDNVLKRVKALLDSES